MLHPIPIILCRQPLNNLRPGDLPPLLFLLFFMRAIVTRSFFTNEARTGILLFRSRYSLQHQFIQRPVLVQHAVADVHVDENPGGCGAQAGEDAADYEESYIQGESYT